MNTTLMDPVVSFDKDYAHKKITVTSKFRAPVSVVWDAFTNPATMEKWWAPKPYKAVTKEMDFREGGRWLYYMLSPKGEKTWSVAEYRSIVPQKSYVATDAFSDENGVIDKTFGSALWSVAFSEKDGVTTVTDTISYETEEVMRKFLDMGFEDGYRQGLSQLRELF